MRGTNTISGVNSYVRLPDEIEEAIRMECAKRRISKPKLIAEVLGVWVAQKDHAPTTHSGDSRITANSIPAKDPEEALGDIPGDVISLLQKHWSDPDFRACVGALGVIWNVGDSAIKDSLARNCHTFARSSEMVEVLNKGVSAKLSPYDRDRIKRLLEHADRIKPQALRSESVSGGAGGSAAGSAEVGGGSIPPGAGSGRPK